MIYKAVYIFKILEKYKYYAIPVFLSSFRYKLCKCLYMKAIFSLMNSLCLHYIIYRLIKSYFQKLIFLIVFFLHNYYA